MSSHRRLIALALAAVLLCGQWLAVAHASEHGLAQGAAHGCAVCVYADGSGHGALPASLTITLRAASEPPAALTGACPLAALLRHHPIRGPPALLA